MTKSTITVLAMAFFFVGMLQITPEADAGRRRRRVRKARKQCNDGAKRCTKFQSFTCVKGFWRLSGVCYDRCADKQTMCAGGTVLVCKNKQWSASSKTCAIKSGKRRRRRAIRKRRCRAGCLMGLSTICVNGKRKFTNKRCQQHNKCKNKAQKCQVGKTKICVYGNWVATGGRCRAPRKGKRGRAKLGKSRRRKRR